MSYSLLMYEQPAACLDIQRRRTNRFNVNSSVSFSTRFQRSPTSRKLSHLEQMVSVVKVQRMNMRLLSLCHRVGRRAHAFFAVFCMQPKTGRFTCTGSCYVSKLTQRRRKTTVCKLQHSEPLSLSAEDQLTCHVTGTLNEKYLWGIVPCFRPY